MLSLIYSWRGGIGFVRWFTEVGIPELAAEEPISYYVAVSRVECRVLKGYGNN